MKKTILILTLLFLTASSSFAGWQSFESWNFHGFDEYGSAQVNNKTLYANINTYVDWISLSYNMSNHQPGGYLDIGVVENGNTILYDYVSSPSSYTHWIVNPTTASYRQSLTVYMECWNSSGTVVLNWGQF
jgi:hypothetical protein